MLTRTIMMHRDYLQLYTCGGEASGLGLSVPEAFDELHALILSTVDTHFNCEDIGINFITNAALTTSAAGPGKSGAVEDAAPLFVKPLHMIGDFGKMGKTGLHQKKSHLTTRTDCLNQMNELFWRAAGEVVLVCGWGLL